MIVIGNYYKTNIPGNALDNKIVKIIGRGVVNNLWRGTFWSEGGQEWLTTVFAVFELNPLVTLNRVNR